MKVHSETVFVINVVVYWLVPYFRKMSIRVIEKPKTSSTVNMS